MATFIRTGHTEIFADGYIEVDLDLTGGRLTLPQGTSLPVSIGEGQLFFDTSTNTFYIGQSSVWEEIEVATTPKVLLLDEVILSSFTYIGEAIPGTATAAAAWRIFRLDESGSGSEELIKLFANGSVLFDQVWDDRAILTYNLP